jgi:hypothetical protein
VTYDVEIQHGDYTGIISVNAIDGVEAVDKAWRMARNRGLLTLPMASQSARIKKIDGKLYCRLHDCAQDDCPEGRW